MFVTALPTTTTCKSWLLLWGSQTGPKLNLWLGLNWQPNAPVLEKYPPSPGISSPNIYFCPSSMWPWKKLRYAHLTTSLLTCTSLPSVKTILKAFDPTKSRWSSITEDMDDVIRNVNELWRKSHIFGWMTFIQQWLTAQELVLLRALKVNMMTLFMGRGHQLSTNNTASQ